MARRAVTSMDLSGPFFTRDPRKTFRQNARVMLARVAEEGEADVTLQLRAGESGRAPISHGVRPNRVSGHVRAVTSYNQPWQVTSGVYVVNRGMSGPQGTALMAAASRVEGQVHAFRKTTNRLRRSRKINAAELLRGIA